MHPAIQLDKVTARYKDHAVLQDLSMTIQPGEMVGILGPNGAGKSTLFNVVSGLLAPAPGTVRIFGADLRRTPPRERAKAIAVVPQELDIPVPYTVEEIVMMGRTVSLGRFSSPGQHDRQAVERAMVYTDVADIRHRPLNELSGGERQRAIVAMVLAQEPRIILMDEATSHLDINHRLEIMQLVERLNREEGVTVMMISHDLQMAAEFSRRLIVLHNGQIAADGTPATVLTPEMLRRVYNCDVCVCQDPQSGGLSILAAPRLPAAGTGKGIHIHLVAGGGSGEAILRRLALCGYTVSGGVINRGDMDAEVGEVLGVKMALEKPFSSISREALQEAQHLAATADAVVLTPVPFGPGNLINLELLATALAAGKPVFIATGIDERDFTPARDAVRQTKMLLERGARPYQDVAELLTLLPAKPGWTGLDN